MEARKIHLHELVPANDLAGPALPLDTELMEVNTIDALKTDENTVFSAANDNEKEIVNPLEELVIANDNEKLLDSSLQGTGGSGENTNTEADQVEIQKILEHLSTISKADTFDNSGLVTETSATETVIAVENPVHVEAAASGGAEATPAAAAGGSGEKEGGDKEKKKKGADGHGKGGSDSHGGSHGKKKKGPIGKVFSFLFGGIGLVYLGALTGFLKLYDNAATIMKTGKWEGNIGLKAGGDKAPAKKAAAPAKDSHGGGHH